MNLLLLVGLLDIVGALEFHLGFFNETRGDGDYCDDLGPGDVDSDAAAGCVDGDANAALGVTPSIEQKLGKVVGVGGEWMFIWIAPDGADGSRLILSPHFRVRMSFPIADRTTFDGLLGLGPSIWTGVDDVPDEAGGATRFGWSVRFAFGASYAFNDAVAATGNLGYYTTTSYGDDLELGAESVLFSLGLRSGF